GAAIDDEVAQDGEGTGAPRLERDVVAVLEPPHVQLAHRRLRIRTVRSAVDEEPARAADALAAVRVESDRILPLADQIIVEGVEHLEERHVRRDTLDRVVFEASCRCRARLTPDAKVDAHDYL